MKWRVRSRPGKLRRDRWRRVRLRAKTQKSDIAMVASVVQRLAVLLAAGVAPGPAWGYLREGELPTLIAQRIARGEPVPDAIVAQLGQVTEAEATAWRGLATAWAVALDAGAPLAATLRDFATSLRSLAQAQREIRVALAEPASTARMVMALPAVGILFGLALGFNTLATLTTTPIGWVCVGVGTVLLLVAARWNHHLVQSAQPKDLTPGLDYDLMAIAVSGGGSLDRAQSSMARAVERYRYPTSGVVPVIDLASGVSAVLDLSRRAGVPAADLLRSEAEEARRRARAEVQEKAASLAVKLMLPLGLCVLPAFMVVGVLPLMVAVITSTNIGL